MRRSVQRLNDLTVATTAKLATIEAPPARSDLHVDEQRTTERRKRATQFRVDVTRLEFEQLRGLMEHVVETMIRLEYELRNERTRIGQLQRELDGLTARVIATSRRQ